MTTAHRPTFDPARGKEALRGPAYHQRLLPAHTFLKTRKPGQGGDADEKRDLKAELLKAEAAHFAKKAISQDASASSASPPTTIEPSMTKRQLENGPSEDEIGDIEDPETKRRKILEETRDIDADSAGSESDSSEDDSDDDEDETAELMRELEKIKKERAEQKAKEEQEREAQEQEKREVDIARGNPLLNPQDFNVKRRWDDDVVFKNQARGTENRGKKEFVNDLLRSDFHKRFMEGAQRPHPACPALAHHPVHPVLLAHLLRPSDLVLSLLVLVLALAPALGRVLVHVHVLLPAHQVQSLRAPAEYYNPQPSTYPMPPGVAPFDELGQDP
ncbi:pre-mRNA-splicing factor cwc15 [Blastomyces percursus]|uniref:Pre-mRNA-splicing factor cwc15 n=1 Tax=Blastomyces percursus TaxID=1658174 RepID=A0A1J9QUH1_9EURO|nr:pre-mRNA-splicing factor cwc15 [Blastomyces percursus]